MNHCRNAGWKGKRAASAPAWAEDELQTTLLSQAQKIVDTETALNDSDGHLTEVKTLYNAIKAENSSLKFKLDDAESRLRRQNLRITEIPEELEG